MKGQPLRSGPALCDGVASGVEVARGSLYYVSTHCLRGPNISWGLVRGPRQSPMSRKPHGVAELCDMAMHVEQMSRGLCPVSIYLPGAS